MKKSFLWRVRKKAVFRTLSAYFFLFVLHQFITIPILGSLLHYCLTETQGNRWSVYTAWSYDSFYSDFVDYIRENKTIPSSISDFRRRVDNPYVLTTSSTYDEWRLKYPGMILAEKRPCRRLILPFPFAMWSVYGVAPVDDYDSGLRRIMSDCEARRFSSFIAKHEGGGFNFALSFVPDVLIYVFWITVITRYFRRQNKRKFAETTTLKRFERFRDACLAFRDQTGRFPTRLDELGIEESTEFRDAFSRRDFLCLSSLGVGVIGATSQPWRAPWVFGRKTYVALEDGSIVTVRGRRAVDFFYDVLWAAEKWRNVGKFYLSKDRLKFEEDELKINRALKIDKALAFSFLTLIFLTPPILFTTFHFIGGTGSTRLYFGELGLAFGVSICLFLGIVPLPILDFYTFVAHSILGII